MLITSSNHGRLFGRALSVIAAAACAISPIAFTTLPMAAMARTTASFSGLSTMGLGQCLGGSGASSCFNAGGSMGTESVNSSAAVGVPILAANVSGSTVFLSWTVPTGDPVSFYVLEAGTAPGLSNLANNPIPPSSGLTVPGVPLGVYYVRIRASGAGGTGGPSNEVVVTVGGCAGPPQGLIVAGQSAGTVALAWTPPVSGGPASYVIAAGSGPGLSDLANFDIGNANPGFVASGISAGSYYVRVHSRSGCGLSAPSNEVLLFVVGFSGDVQVSVSWNAPSDVDLHVVEPSGEEQYYGHPASATGGQLDVDSNAACAIDGRQVENIRWPGRAPAGPYTVRVDYWDSCGVAATNYVVTLRNGLSTQTFVGSFTGAGDHGGAGSGVTIGSFFHAAADSETSADEALVRALALFTPSPIKLLRSNNQR